MFRWNLMLRTLFGLRYDQAKARQPKKPVKLHLEVLEDRTVPSALGPNPLGFETVASRPPVPSVATLASPAPVPSVAAFTSSVFATVDHWFQFMATAEQEFLGDLTLVTQEFAQLESSVRQQVGRFLGNNSNATNPALNTAVTQPGNDIGMGRGNSSGSGSGSSASTTHNSPNQPINQSTQQTGRGSGSGSSSTTNHPIATAHGGIVHPMTSGTGSGTGTGSGASGSGTGSVGNGTGSGYAIVGGKLWLDNDGDGSWDNGELGYQGATVELMSASMQPYSIAAVATTGSDGSYVFPRQLLGPSPQPFFVHVDLTNLNDAFTPTFPGSSQINNAGNSSIFDLAAGGWRKIRAGILSMNVSTTEDHPPNQPIQDQVTLGDAIKTGNNGGGPLALNKVTFYDFEKQQELSGTITLQGALDPIKRSYDIYYEPGAPGLTVDGNNSAGTIFTVNAGVTSTISNLTIEGGSGANGGGVLNNGNLTLMGDYIQDNQTAGSGGGIYNGAGASLNLTQDTVNGNGAQKTGGGADNFGTVDICGSEINGNTAFQGGGGIDNHSGGTVTASDGTHINGNSDSSTGGGVSNTGTFTLYGGSISNNIGTNADADGGGVYNDGKMTLSGVTVQGNQGQWGGGLFADGGSLTLKGNVTIGGSAAGQPNKARADGGGMDVEAGTVKMTSGAISANSAGSKTAGGGRVGGLGGGLFFGGGSLTLTKVSISGNAGSAGGGVAITGGTVKMSGGTIYGNAAQGLDGGGIYVKGGSLTLKNNVSVWYNKAERNGGGIYINGGTVSVSGGFIEQNIAFTNSGGGVYNNAGSLTLKDSPKTSPSVSSNTAANQGGGFYLAAKSKTTFTNCLVASNRAIPDEGEGVYEQNGLTVNEVGLVDNNDPNNEPVKGP